MARGRKWTFPADRNRRDPGTIGKQAWLRAGSNPLCRGRPLHMVLWVFCLVRVRMALRLNFSKIPSQCSFGPHGVFHASIFVCFLKHLHGGRIYLFAFCNLDLPGIRERSWRGSATTPILCESDFFITMQVAPLPPDEAERNSSLKALKILETPLEERFERVTRLASRLLDVPITAISFLDGNRQWFKSIQGLNVDETPRDISFCGHAVMGEGIFIVEDASKDERFHDNPLVVDAPGIRFYAGQPLKSADGKIIGTLCVIDKRPRRLTPNQIEDLKDLAAMVEIEIKSKQLAVAQILMNEELNEARKAVLVDPLTRLWNRAGGEEFLARQHQLAIQKNEKFCIAMIDIDHFKKVNDRHGHPAGDEVLRQVARRILKTIRSEDFACRMGGEEFLLMINDPMATDALLVAQQVRDAIRATPVVVEGKEIPVTISMGLAYFDPAGSVSCEEVIKLADACLYRAKQTGRDRIISHIENSA